MAYHALEVQVCNAQSANSLFNSPELLFSEVPCFFLHICALNTVFYSQFSAKSIDLLLNFADPSFSAFSRRSSPGVFRVMVWILVFFSVEVESEAPQSCYFRLVRVLVAEMQWLLCSVYYFILYIVSIHRTFVSRIFLLKRTSTSFLKAVKKEKNTSRQELVKITSPFFFYLFILRLRFQLGVDNKMEKNDIFVLMRKYFLFSSTVCIIQRACEHGSVHYAH